MNSVLSRKIGICVPDESVNLAVTNVCSEVLKRPPVWQDCKMSK